MMRQAKDEKSETEADEIVFEVTQEDYEAGLRRGWTDDDMLKPGRYRLRRGGFLARHPELKRAIEEARVTNSTEEATR